MRICFIITQLWRENAFFLPWNPPLGRPVSIIPLLKTALVLLAGNLGFFLVSFRLY